MEERPKMPTPPQNLRKMPPPPPIPKVEKVESLEEETTAIEKENPIVEEETKGLVQNEQMEIFMQPSDEATEESSVKNKKKEKKDGGLKKVLYWGGFVLSLALLAFFVFMLVK